MTDNHFHLADVRQEGDAVPVTAQISGTHSGEDLDLSSMGLPTVPAGGESFQLPQEEITVTTKGNKITSVRCARVESGGLMGILSQLRVEVPPR